MTYRILVTGSRDWTDKATIMRALLNAAKEAPFGEEIVLVHGACPAGADKLADEAAQFLGWKIERHPADWALLGRRAGPVRNKEMVKLGANICLAFPLGKSAGTRGCMRLAEKALITVDNYGDKE